jgi:ABC-2 type transport system ATP-binding protein
VVSSLDDGWRVHGVADPSAVTRALAEEGVYLSELSRVAADLESVFLDLTEDRP